MQIFSAIKIKIVHIYTSPKLPLLQSNIVIVWNRTKNSILTVQFVLKTNPVKTIFYY